MQKVNQQKIAIVTGGGSGIGLAIAEKFVQGKILTIIVGRDRQKLDKAKEQLGDLCHSICQDLNDLSAIPRLVQQVVDQYGRIDILVNNAGINLKKDFTETTDEEFDGILHTNIKVMFAFILEVVKAMIPSEKGNIINISSMASQYGIPKVIAYTASKSAIEGMTPRHGGGTFAQRHPGQLYRSRLHFDGHVIQGAERGCRAQTESIFPYPAGQDG